MDDHLGEQLRRSAKNRSEHEIVVRRIERVLRPHSVWVETGGEPELIKVANIQHLATPIHAQLADARSAVELAGLLHPTPGDRWRAARVAPWRRSRSSRAWTAAGTPGAIGWMDAAEDGEFCVGIRSALLRDRTAHIFAGNGIVADSDPAEELAETELKLGRAAAAARRLMATLPRPLVERIARYAVRPWWATPPRLHRPVLELLARASVTPGGVAVSRQARGGVFGELARPAGDVRSAEILYLHGGAYRVGSPATHRNVVATLALRSGLPVFAADYRLAPEHPAPAALDDGLAAYEAMLAESANGVALAGDSAGGGLAVALAVAARDRGLPTPRRLALISPWMDQTLSGASITENDRKDALLTRSVLERGAEAYASALGREDPVCSPIRADLTGLPPILIHAGANEMILSDARALAARAGEAGVEAELRVFDGLWHDFHVHAGMLAEADEALAEMGAWLAR